MEKRTSIEGILHFSTQYERLESFANNYNCIRTREENLLQMNHPYFDEFIGWGHKIQSPDVWEDPNAKGTKWTWFAAFADQVRCEYYTLFIRYLYKF